MKNIFVSKILPACLALALLLVAGAPVKTGLYAQTQKSGISRSMEQAIRLYHEGEDNEALDRFMNILVKGSPTEKALANEYISKITLRMNTGVNTLKDQETEIGAMNTIKPAPKAGTISGGQNRREAAPDDEETGGSQEQQRKTITEKITSKIALMRRDLLLELSQSASVKVYMGESMPKAITLDTDFFFAGDTSFRTGTDKMLSAVSGLIFTLGRVNCLLLPEGAAAGDVKIKNIRRALALNSYLEARGVSKAKLDVNLTGSEVQFPKELNNLNGLIILFNYDKEPRLKDLEDLQTKGPKVSLGVYPTAIAVHNNEGAVVEFSAFESPIGQPSWTFQVFQIQKDNSRLQLQEISGHGAQYNQSFWNGRNKFFGAAYPSGKYMFTVTAKDVEGRETSLSRLLVIRPTPEEEKAMEAKPALPREKGADTVTPSGIKSRTVRPGAGGRAGKVLGGVRKAKGTGTLKKNVKKYSSAGKAAKNKAEADAGVDPAAEAGAGVEGKSAADNKASGGETPEELSGRVSYKIYFKENTATITANSEKKLAQVAETLSYYPMANIALTGYAYSGEANAENMAENRVNYVASRLTEKYKIAKARMDVKFLVSETPKSTVEIQMTGNE
ncbi:MAG: hypothetical protein A2285_05990 [Elusimicrobia bacterium RIFOXYA12_FULL_57_11]|nr:MAG: hypothetical protein A2285_05990 [Elusimicrobia bacterium RIFOXYA12_FULL_57_11]